MRLYLVTTSLQESWPNDGQPVLLLGRWCERYGSIDLSSYAVKGICEYRFDDRSYLHESEIYLDEVYERYLAIVSSNLNKIHNLDYSIRLWRVIVGPWLRLFIGIVHERRSNVMNALAKYNITDTIYVEDEGYNSTSGSMADFLSAIKSDYWNHLLYCKIIAHCSPKTIFSRQLLRADSGTDHSHTVSSSFTSRSITKKKSVLMRLYKHFARKNKYFIHQTYLDKFSIIRLFLSLGQAPSFYREETYPCFPSNTILRNELSNGFKPSNEFEEILLSLIPEYLPTSYLESFGTIRKSLRALPLPSKPEIIWTANAHFSDDYFKIWSAVSIQNKTRLIISQHGGHYGQGLFFNLEDHERTISDSYLTWGWKDGGLNSIPFGYLPKRQIYRERSNTRNKILILISSTSRYSGGIASMPISSQWLDYLGLQIEFYNALPLSYQDDVCFRLYPHDYGWEQDKRLLAVIPSVQFDSEPDFSKSMLSSTVFVSGWNTTTYLEALVAGVPTVLFWDPNTFEVRDSAKKYFDLLRHAQILHDSPSSAAEHLSKVYNNINAWWDNSTVKNAREAFVEQYARRRGSLFELRDILTNHRNSAR